MNPLYFVPAVLGVAVGQSDPASHGFTINAPGLTNTASFGYGAGGSVYSPPAAAAVAVAPPAAASLRPTYKLAAAGGGVGPAAVVGGGFGQGSAAGGAYRPIPFTRPVRSEPAAPQITVTRRAYTLSNVGSVGGPTGSVIGERRLLGDSKAVLPRQPVGAGVPQTTVVSLNGAGGARAPNGAPAPLSNYFGGGASRGRLVGANGAPIAGGSPLNPSVVRGGARVQYIPPPSRGNFAPSHGYTVNAPGFTKHKTFAGPAVHGTNQAFLHASSG